MDKSQDHDYVAIDTENGGIRTGRSRLTSYSFQDNFDVFNAAIENGDTTRLKLLLRIYPESDFEILSCRNEYGQTLLHLVASSRVCPHADRVTITELIYKRINKGPADLKAIFRTTVDDLKNSPLHDAAKYKRKLLLYWYVKKRLLEGLFDENTEGMSPFHLLVSARSKDFVSAAIKMWQCANLGELQYNFTRFSPLHIAAKDGLLEMLEFLVEKAKFSPDVFGLDGDDHGYYPIHYAIKYSDDSCPTSLLRIKYLVEKTSPRCFRTEHFLDSPIHVAAKFGKPNILKYLLSLDLDENTMRGKMDIQGQLFFVPTTINANRQTCLHVVPNESIPEQCVECVRIILNQVYLGYSRYREEFCMKKDKFNKTVLDYAAEFDSLEVCREILGMVKCDISSKWLAHTTLSLLYQRVPDALIPVFESCLTKKSVLSRRQYFITGDLAPILGERKYNDPKSMEKPESYYLHRISSIDTRIRNKVLRNPLVERFIQAKFNVISNFLLAGCVFQITYIILYTIIAYVSFEKCAKINNSTHVEEIGEWETPIHYCNELDGSEKLLAILVLISALILLGKEIYQLIRSKTWQSHFKKYSNWMQLVFTMITLSTTLSFIPVNRNRLIEYNFHRILTVCGVLLGGILSLYEFKKISKFGEFSRIFWKVAKKSALLFAYYCMLIFAFMVSFRILTPEKGDFLLPFGLVKVIAMMVGEYEFDGNFERTGTSTDYLILSKLVVFTLFIFVAAIVGLNLLIGLAVEDIQALKADAHTEILATQLEQIYMTEKFIISLRPFIGQKWFYKILNKTNLIINSAHSHSRRYYYSTFEFPISSDLPANPK